MSDGPTVIEMIADQTVDLVAHAASGLRTSSLCSLRWISVVRVANH
jgi:hypothetical protein